jgi:hemerythrin-like metal-binding protein
MDQDHYALEQMFARTSRIEDGDLPAHLDAILEEITAHFAREEAEMERVGVPILHCHKGQHAALLQEGATLRKNFSRAEARMRRHLIGFTLAQLVANHIATVDQISSTFFNQKIDYRQAEPANCGG